MLGLSATSNQLPMNLSRPAKMYPNKLSESGGVVVFESFSVPESLKDRVAPDQSLVQPSLSLTVTRIIVEDLVSDSADTREIGHH